MSALRKEQVSPEINEEVIYLIVPPALAPPAPKTTFLDLYASLYLGIQNIRHRQGNKAFAATFATTAILAGAAYAYYVKSAFGIDFLPAQHIEDFVPLPGWGR